MESKSSTPPTAFISFSGQILDCNEEFCNLVQLERNNVINQQLTNLCKFLSPLELLEANYTFDQFSSAALKKNNVENWHALLNTHTEHLFEVYVQPTIEQITINNDNKRVFRAVAWEHEIRRDSTQRRSSSNASMCSKQASESKLNIDNSNSSSSNHLHIAPTKIEDQQASPSKEKSCSKLDLQAVHPADTTHQDHLSILIVDDSPLALKMMTRVIQQHSNTHQVSSAVNGVDALQLLREQWFDIVLMDINMPLMNGLEASHEFRKIERERFLRSARQSNKNTSSRALNTTSSPTPRREYQKIIAMSADISNSLFHEVTMAGFDGFIPKPLTAERFLEVLQMPIGDATSQYH